MEDNQQLTNPEFLGPKEAKEIADSVTRNNLSRFTIEAINKIYEAAKNGKYAVKYRIFGYFDFSSTEWETEMYTVHQQLSNSGYNVRFDSKHLPFDLVISWAGFEVAKQDKLLSELTQLIKELNRKNLR